MQIAIAVEDCSVLAPPFGVPDGILCLTALNNSAYLGYEHKTHFLAPHLSLSYQFARLQKHLKFPTNRTRGGS